MLYYINYNPAEDKRYVLAYDEEKHGKAQVVNDHTVFFCFIVQSLSTPSTIQRMKH